MAPGVFLGYDATPKTALAFLAAALLLAGLGRWWPGVAGLWRTGQGRCLYLMWAASAASLFLSASLAHDRMLAFGGTSFRHLGALTQMALLLIAAAVAAYASLDQGFVRVLLIAIEAAGGLAAIYGVMQYAGWDPWLPAEWYTTHFTGDVVRPSSTLRHATYFANFLLPVILVAAVSARRQRRERWFHGAVLIVSLAALVLTGTRSAVLGLAAGGVLAAYVEARRAGGRRIMVYAAAGAAAVVGAVALFAVSPAGQSVRIRLAQWVQDIKGGPRAMVWRDSGRLILEHWMTGIGPEEFAGEFRKVQSLELSRAYPETYHEDPHNMLVGCAVSQGLAGLGLMAAWIVLGLGWGYQGIRTGAAESGMLLSSLVAMVVSFQFSPMTVTNWLYLYATIALLAAIVARGAAAGGKPLRMARILGWGWALVAIVVAGAYLTQDFLVAATGRRLAQGDLEGARADLELARRFPFSADYYWCSQQMAAAARAWSSPWREGALALAKQASAGAEVGDEQRFKALYQSAVLAVVTRDFASAEVKLRAEIEAGPWWYRAHMMLAQVLWITGRGAEAEREGGLALKCAGSAEDRVRRVLEESRSAAKAKALPRSGT